MKKFLLFVLLFGSSFIWAQNNPDPFKFTSLVDLHEFPSVGATGNLEAQIPLYTISNKGLDIPVALNYDQMGNSNVFYIGNQFGDAWVLSASGTIRRECEDRPTATLISSVVTNSSCAGTYTKVTYRNHSLQNDEYFYSINSSATSRSRPDVYTFSFLGLTGKFIIKKQGSQYVAEITETSDFAKITIDSPPSSGNNYNFSSISITDKNGYRYKYASPTNINANQSNKVTYASGLVNVPPGCTLDPGSGETPYEGVELVGGGGTTTGNGLISSQVITGTSTFWENLELTEIYDKNNNLLVSYQYDTTGFSNPGGFQWVNGLATMQSFQKLYLKKINIINQGSINFTNIYGTNEGNVVKSYTSGIEVRDLKNNLIKKVTFDYLVTTFDNIKYLKDFKDNSYGLRFNKRLLSAVKEYNNTSSQNFLQTTVEYKNTAITNTNVVVDRYGFLTKVGYCFSHQHFSKADYKADSYILQRIKYPTGGSIVYKFEPNTFSHSLYNTDMTNYNYDNHVYTENTTLIRSGSTATFTAIAGDTIYVLNTVPNHSLYLYKKVSGTEQLVRVGFNSMDGQSPLTVESCKHLFTSLVLPPSENNQYVFKYSSTLANTSGLKVYRKSDSDTYYNFRYAEGNRLAKIATFKDNVGKDILNNPNGEDLAEKVVTFDYSSQTESNTSSGRVRTPASPKQELLPFNVIYDEVTTTVKGVGKQYVKYGFPYNSNWNENIRTDIKESKSYDVSNQLIAESTHAYTYDTPKMFILSNTVTSKNYEGGNFVQNTGSKVYDNVHRQLSSMTAEDNLGKTTKSELTYQTINNAVLNTQANNYVNNNLKEQVLNTYDSSANLTSSRFKTPEMSSYEQIGMINPHYYNGLLLGYTQLDGTFVTLIYGYNDTQLVAKIVNVDPPVYYADPGYGSIRSNISIQSNQNLSGYSEANLKTTLNGLRTTFPNAMVTTYTYKPMVGISSITDENGKTATFEYDTFNRLATVKDNAGNILKEYQYNITN